MAAFSQRIPALAKALAWSPTPFRRVRPSDRDWPSAASWEKLKLQVGGRLEPVQFPLAACQSSFESAGCQAVVKNIRNPYYVGDQPGLTETSGWVDAWVSKPSAYVVAARTADDIAAAVNFARENRRIETMAKAFPRKALRTEHQNDRLRRWSAPGPGLVWLLRCAFGRIRTRRRTRRYR